MIVLGLVIVAAGVGLLLWAGRRAIRHVDLWKEPLANYLPLFLDSMLAIIGTGLIAFGIQVIVGMV